MLVHSRPRLFGPSIACVVLAALGGCVSQATRDDTLSAAVDDVVRASMQEERVPGVSIAIVREGNIIKATGYGVANLELNVPVTPQSVFEIGSISKQFTAAAVMLLVEDGKIALDDPITKYFPQTAQDWNAVTIRQLLTHTSGLPDIWGDTEETLYNRGIVDFRRDYTEDELVRIYAARPLEFPPGTKWSYCNACYQVLGFLIHRVSGQTYHAFLHARIFKPLGMDATRVSSWTDVIANRATGYEPFHGEFKHREWVSPTLFFTADGGLVSTVEDMARWDAALYAEHPLTRAQREAMWNPSPITLGTKWPYGMAWRINDVNGHRLIWHVGGGFGFSAIFSRYVDDKLTIIALTNVGEFDVRKLAGSIASLYLPDTKGANPVRDLVTAP